MKITFTVEQYAEAKEKAKELGINPVGKSKQTLVDLVNAALNTESAADGDGETTARTKKEKWYKDGYGYEPGQVVEIMAKTVTKGGVVKDILKGRQAVIVKPSENEGQVKAILLNKNGEKQNCEISLEISKIFLVTQEEAAPAEEVA